MPYITDTEFGRIRVHRSRLSRHVRLKISHEGELVASLPLRLSQKHVVKLINDSRDELRNIISQKTVNRRAYQNGDDISPSYKLEVAASIQAQPSHVIKQGLVSVFLPASMNENSFEAQDYIREVIEKVLRKEAKNYIPSRVEQLALTYGFSYNSIRFNNAKSRWGSCSSKNNLNFNVALMRLPTHLIDYVIVHELAHTKFMNHSPEFWAQVGQVCPDYKNYRKTLRTHSPTI